MLKYWIIGWISLIMISGLIFFGASWYESENNCRITISWDIPFINCDEFQVGPFYFWDMEWWLYKPLILLYPQKPIDIEVSLNYAPGFFATFPEFNYHIGGWSVLAHPDGTLYDRTTQQETYGLFWEWYWYNNWDMTKGFVVPGSDIREFLYSKLTEIWLNTKERSDFIMFWYPKLQDYKFLQITFAGEEYNERAKLNITPKPDSLLRVFMVVKPLEFPVQIPKQELVKFERLGFSVVEWWGTIIK